MKANKIFVKIVFTFLMIIPLGGVFIATSNEAVFAESCQESCITATTQDWDDCLKGCSSGDSNCENKCNYEFGRFPCAESSCVGIRTMDGGVCVYDDMLHTCQNSNDIGTPPGAGGSLKAWTDDQCAKECEFEAGGTCDQGTCNNLGEAGKTCQWVSKDDKCVTTGIQVGVKPQFIQNKVNVSCGGGEGFDTALGCVITTPIGITNFFLRFFIAIGLGIAVIKGGLAVWKWRNSDSPDKKQEATKDLMLVFTGIVLLFLAIPLLKFIGIDVLGLDQFGGGVLKDILSP